VATVLGPRALNRATLARQLLLERAPLSLIEAVERLGGMQSQAPLAPYVGLWSRLLDADTDALSRLTADRTVVRTHLMRNTIHLVSARDCLAWTLLFGPLRATHFTAHGFARRLPDLDHEEVLAAARALLEERPATKAELGRRLAERWPDADPSALAYLVTHHLPLVQPPPRGVWGSNGPALCTPVDTWLGRAPEPRPDLDGLVLRCLAAFGPASVADVQAWSGLSRLAEVVERLRPRLLTFRDEQGRDLFELPDSPRPDPETPAPVRFLPEYDNLLLSHADRSRVIPDGRPVPLPPGNGANRGTLLVDGFWRGTWRIGDAVLEVTTFGRLAAAEAAEVEEEGRRLLEFVTGGAAGVVRVAEE